MLRSIHEIMNYKLLSRDGDIGKAKDFLFDDRWWAVRYMTTDTGSWLAKKKVLVSPVFIDTIDWKSQTILMNITHEQIENCPPIEENMPVSREYEVRFFNYYGYPYYWAGDAMWGMFPYPANLNAIQAAEFSDDADIEKTNHLRSVKEVIGYGISTTDGDIGHVEDFILNDETWALKYMVVDTRNWLPGGKKTLLPPDWISYIDWMGSEAAVDLSVSQVENSPEYDPDKPVNVEYEMHLYDYYGRPFEV